MLFDSPVILVLSTIDQVYVVFAGTISFPAFEGVMLKASPLHIVCALAAIVGFALILTRIVKLSPTQDPIGEVGVTV